jgi:hypothetical protein
MSRAVDLPPWSEAGMDRDVRPRRAVFTPALFARAAFAVLVLISVLFGYGVPGRDRATLEAFTDAVDRWQVHPEFRALAAEYSVRGSEALRTRPLLVPADRLIIVARSCPLLPERYGLSPTCRLHYENFSRGPLSAYLHLADEQGVRDVVSMVEELGRRCRERADDGPGLPDEADLREFLAAFKMDAPVVMDAGALQSVAALVADTDAASRRFQYRAAIGAALVPHVQALARDMGFPADVRRMTVVQQRAVLDRLDAYVRRRDPELWRTKQVSDFCAGIWAHVFGRSYNLLLKPILALHALGRAAVWALLLWAAVAWLRGRQRSAAAGHAFSVERAAGAGAGAEAVSGARVAEVISGATSARAPGPRRPAASRRRPV